MKFTTLLILITGCICLCFTPQKGKVVQIDIAALLNARPVTTLTRGKLVSWTKGIDGGGEGDGYLTHAAAELNGDKDAHALPDNPIFLPDAGHHPEIKLHYNNPDGTHPQARSVAGAGEFTIKIPTGRYEAIYLGLSSAEGPSELQFDLEYTDGKESKSYLLPDYYNNVSEKYPDLSYIATDLAKWGKKDKMTEKDHHNIHLLKLTINPNKKLKAIRVKKSKGGYLIFWSATGVRVG